MNQKHLIWISISCSIVGLIILFFTLDVNVEDEEEFLKIKGTVQKIIDKNNIKIIYFKPSGSLQLVSFKKELEFQEGDEITARGYLKNYKGKLELVVEDVIK